MSIRAKNEEAIAKASIQGAAMGRCLWLNDGALVEPLEPRDLFGLAWAESVINWDLVPGDLLVVLGDSGQSRGPWQIQEGYMADAKAYCVLQKFEPLPGFSSLESQALAVCAYWRDYGGKKSTDCWRVHHYGLKGKAKRPDKDEEDRYFAAFEEGQKRFDEKWSPTAEEFNAAPLETPVVDERPKGEPYIPIIVSVDKRQKLIDTCERFNQVKRELDAQTSRKAEIMKIIKGLEAEQVNLGQTMTDIILGKADPQMSIDEEIAKEDIGHVFTPDKIEMAPETSTENSPTSETAADEKATGGETESTASQEVAEVPVDAGPGDDDGSVSANAVGNDDVADSSENTRADV